MKVRNGLLERAVVLTCVVVSAVLVLVLSVLHLMEPKRVKVSVGVWKLVNLSFEADAGGEAKELPPSKG